MSSMLIHKKHLIFVTDNPVCSKDLTEYLMLFDIVFAKNLFFEKIKLYGFFNYNSFRRLYYRWRMLGFFRLLSFKVSKNPCPDSGFIVITYFYSFSACIFRINGSVFFYKILNKPLLFKRFWCNLLNRTFLFLFRFFRLFACFDLDFVFLRVS